MELIDRREEAKNAPPPQPQTQDEPQEEEEHKEIPPEDENVKAVEQEIEQVNSDVQNVQEEAKQLEADLQQSEQQFKEIEEQLKQLPVGPPQSNSPKAGPADLTQLAGKLEGLVIERQEEPEGERTGSPLEFRDEPDDEPKVPVDVNLPNTQPPCNTKMSDDEADNEDEIKFENQNVNFDAEVNN